MSEVGGGRDPYVEIWGMVEDDGRVKKESREKLPRKKEKKNRGKCDKGEAMCEGGEKGTCHANSRNKETVS